MEIEHIEEKNGGEFKIDKHNEKAASLTYTLFGSGRLVINHTEVQPSLQGKDVARKLIDAAADFARSKNYKILPVCPFSKRYMQAKTEKYADVLV